MQQGENTTFIIHDILFNMITEIETEQHECCVCFNEMSVEKLLTNCQHLCCVPCLHKIYDTKHPCQIKCPICQVNVYYWWSTHHYPSVNYPSFCVCGIKLIRLCEICSCVIDETHDTNDEQHQIISDDEDRYRRNSDGELMSDYESE